MANLFRLRQALCMGTAMVLLSASAMSATGDVEPTPSITVSGQGSADVAPDMAVLTLTVTREGKTARAALDANSSAMVQVIKTMEGRGIATRDLQTSSFSIQPRYTQPARSSSGEREAPRIDGYTVRNSLTVRLRDISKLGEVLDESVTLGVNDGGSILFTNDDASAVVAEARVKAVEDAIDKARTLASAAGVKTGRILSISEQSSSPRPMPMARAEMAMMKSADAVPVAIGENTYRVSVNLSFAIEQ